jgi:hypothetical protein
MTAAIRNPANRAIEIKSNTYFVPETDISKYGTLKREYLLACG